MQFDFCLYGRRWAAAAATAVTATTSLEYKFNSRTFEKTKQFWVGPRAQEAANFNWFTAVNNFITSLSIINMRNMILGNINFIWVQYSSDPSNVRTNIIVHTSRRPTSPETIFSRFRIKASHRLSHSMCKHVAHALNSYVYRPWPGDIFVHLFVVRFF